MSKSAAQKTIKESVTQSCILEFLGFCRCVSQFWRVNTGAAKYSYKTKAGIKKEYFVRYGVKGQSDIQGYMTDGVALFIEVKRPKGGKRTPEQIEFIRNANLSGAIGIFATSIEDVQNEFIKRGYL